MKGRFVILTGIALLLICCGQPAPQRPSQRKGTVPAPDSTQLALMALNQQMAETADNELLRAIRQQEESYALYSHGTWAHIIAQGEGEAVQPGETCTLRMRVYSLNGEMYLDTEQTGVTGKYVWPKAIDENIHEWRHGARLRLFAPWYAAYGIHGTDEVPPYENVMIDLEIR